MTFLAKEVQILPTRIPGVSKPATHDRRGMKMGGYHRAWQPDGMQFLTVVTKQRPRRGGLGGVLRGIGRVCRAVVSWLLHSG
jgi:hypothetical protein